MKFRVEIVERRDFWLGDGEAARDGTRDLEPETFDFRLEFSMANERLEKATLPSTWIHWHHSKRIGILVLSS